MRRVEVISEQLNCQVHGRGKEMVNKNSFDKHEYFCSKCYQASALLSLLLLKAKYDLKLFLPLLDEGIGG